MGIMHAVEAIDHQHDSYASNIEQIIATLVDKVTETGSALVFNDSPEVKEIEKATFKRLGIQIKIDTSGHPASVIPYFPKEDHVFISEQIRKSTILRDQEDFRRRSIGKKGTVDLKAAKVGGVFSEYTTPLFLNIGKLVLMYKLDAGEITAIFLHELGHVFSTYEYSNHQDRTYETLSEVGRRLRNNRDPAMITYVHSELKTIGIEIDKDEITKCFSGSGAYIGAFISLVVKQLVASSFFKLYELSNYKDTTYEDLSDSFASRFGYGLKLASSHNKRLNTKISRYPPLVLLNNICSVYITVVFVIACLLGPIAPLVSVLYLFPPALLFNLVFKLIEYYQGNEGNGRDLIGRYKEVRAECIELLKTKDLDRALVSSTLETIYAVDDVVKSDKKSIFDKIVDKVVTQQFLSKKGYLNSKIGEDMLRDLEANRLFIASAEIRTLKD